MMFCAVIQLFPLSDPQPIYYEIFTLVKYITIIDKYLFVYEFPFYLWGLQGGMDKLCLSVPNLMYRNFKVAVVARTLVRIGCKRTEVRATLKK